MIFLRLCCVRMYAAFCPKCRYKATQGSTLKKLADAKLHRDYEDAVAVLDRIPKEVLAAYTHKAEKERETAYGR